MRLVSVKALHEGMKLASTIYNPSGKALLFEGIILSKRMIQRLIDLNIQYLYIQDALSEGIESRSKIDDQVRISAVKEIENTFTSLQSVDFSKKAIFLEEHTKDFKSIISTVLSQIKGNNDLLTILSDVFTYDSYIFQHSFNVTLYTLAIGLEMKMSPKDLDMLGLGAILHDIGKMMVPEEILLKPDRLTEEEFTAIKKHTEDGFEILRQLHGVSLIVAHCAFQHHERLDGSGYPRGIEEKTIHPFAKIIAVADVFDAVTSNRVYRNAMLPHEGLELLYAGVGTLYDRKVVEAFRNSVAIYPNGMTVILNDGRKGIVSKQNKGFADRPFIRIIEDESSEENAPYEIDLKDHLNVVIKECEFLLELSPIK